jgi:hypothetical protein
MKRVCFVAALLAVVFIRPVAAADVSCAEWLAYRAGDTSLQGQAPAFAAFVQGYIDAVNDYSDLVSGVSRDKVVPPHVSTAAALDRLCSVFDPTDSAVAMGVNDLHTEMNLRVVPFINSILSKMIDNQKQEIVVTRPLILKSPHPAAEVSCAEWLAYRAGDTSLQGQALAFAAFVQGYIDAVNDYSGIVSEASRDKFVPPQMTFASTAAALDRQCPIDPTQSAVTIGMDDLHTEIRVRVRTFISSLSKMTNGPSK